jgi:hypothetical protein
MDKLTADDAFELGNTLRSTAIAIGDWRIENRASLTRAQWDALDDQEITLLNAASDLHTRAIGLVLTDAQPGLAQLRSSARKARAAVRRIQTVKQALELVSAVILLGVAVSSGNVDGVMTGIQAVNEAAAAIPKPGDDEEA